MAENNTHDEINAKIAQMGRLIDDRIIRDSLEPALAGVEFASDFARQQALGMLRSRLTVADTKAVGPEGKPVEEYVRDRLGSTEFSHFLKPGHSPRASNLLATPGTPTSIDDLSPGGQQLWGAMTRTYGRIRGLQTEPDTDPATDMSRQFGLRGKPRR